MGLNCPRNSAVYSNSTERLGRIDIRSKYMYVPAALTIVVETTFDCETFRIPTLKYKRTICRGTTTAQHRTLFMSWIIILVEQEAFEKCWAHSPLRAAARPFTRCRYCRTPPLSHVACASMSTTTTTTTTRDRGYRYGPIEWAQLELYASLSLSNV